mmetsp:Transcript_61980/g.119467  ORF Transcript_61980/g.119467 Transcript_61980/m.119467 type:complete len:488 (-) Transcript_61980:152-1615(-)
MSVSKVVVGTAAALVLATRASDARHIPRLVLEDNSPVKTLKMWMSAFAIFGYERIVAAILRRLGMTRMPSTLAAMLSLFSILRATQKISDRSTSDKLAQLFRPGVDFLGKWMGLFLAPPLASLDTSIARLPPYGPGVWCNACALLGAGWAATHAAAAAVATSLAPQKTPLLNSGKQPTNAAPASVAPAPAAAATHRSKQSEVVSLDEAVRRAWVVIGAAGYLGVACSSLLPAPLHRPIGMLCEASTTVNAFTLGKLLPTTMQRVLHPLVICAFSSNLAGRLVGPVAPYLDNGNGVGDLFFKWLAAAVTGLGVRMYNTTELWLDSPEDFRCVLATCSASGCISLGVTALGAVFPQSPLSVPAPLSLPMLHRSVMSALGIEGSLAIGPECDPKLAVASILITGCIGASLGNALLEALPGIFDFTSPVVRGVAMGCSAHSIGTAGLISVGDTSAAAISGASMCLAGTAHTLVLNLPGVVPGIRKLAKLKA